MIYVVTKGVYSNYHIVGVYDDEIIAEKVADAIGARVEEYELNENSEQYANCG